MKTMVYLVCGTAADEWWVVSAWASLDAATDEAKRREGADPTASYYVTEWELRS